MRHGLLVIKKRSRKEPAEMRYGLLTTPAIAPALEELPEPEPEPVPVPLDADEVDEEDVDEVAVSEEVG